METDEQENKTGKLKLLFPKWSGSALFIVTLLVALASFTLVLVIGTKPLWVELEIASGIVSLWIFGFLFYCLYFGVELTDDGKLQFLWIKVDNPYSSQLLAEATLEGCFWILLYGLQALLFIFYGIILILFLWLMANVAWLIIFVIGISLYWIFYNSMRVALSKRNICKRDFLNSVLYSLFYTALYTGWLYLVFYVGHRLGR